MTRDELKEQKAFLYKEYDKKLAALDREYAFSHNHVKPDDIIENNSGCILKVTKVTYCRETNISLPECVYHGVQLTKQLKPRSKQDCTAIWQNSLIKINGKEVKKDVDSVTKIK